METTPEVRPVRYLSCSRVGLQAEARRLWLSPRPACFLTPALTTQFPCVTPVGFSEVCVLQILEFWAHWLSVNRLFKPAVTS